MSEGADWKDLLTAFDGSSITCGPISDYNGTRRSFNWANSQTFATASNKPIV